MALKPLRDLEPRYDVRGGSPKTPVPPFSQAEYQQYSMPTTEHGNGVWKVLATGAVSLLLGFVVAWWTALQGRGVTPNELHEYVKEYSPWVLQKGAIEKQISEQTQQIGEIRGRQDGVLQRLSKVEFQLNTDERDFTKLESETKKNNEIVTGYLESLKSKK